MPETAIPILDPEDPRLIPFRAVADPQRIREQGLFVAEGRRVVADLIASGRFDVRGLLVTQSARAALGEVLPAFPGEIEVLTVEGPAVLRDVTGYRFHQGCLALAALPTPRPFADAVSYLAEEQALVLVLEGVTDPDNVGTIFRSACAFGVDAVLLGPGCAHPLYRKALRTSLGTALRVPFFEAETWPAELDLLAQAGFARLALTPAAEAHPLDDVVEALASPGIALMLGSEEKGLSTEALVRATARVRIVHLAGIDSLNVAAAAAISLHALHVRRSS